MTVGIDMTMEKDTIQSQEAEFATKQEVAWATAIQQAAQADPEIRADVISDLEFFQHAVVAKDNVDKALGRIRRMQKFKEMYGIQGNGSFEQGLRDAARSLELQPGLSLGVGVLDDHTHCMCMEYRHFKTRLHTTPESIAITLRGAFYGVQSCQDSLPAIRAGVELLVDAKGVGWVNFDLKVEERMAQLSSNAYPLRVRSQVVMNINFWMRLLMKAANLLFLSKKLRQVQVLVGNRDAYLREQAHRYPKDALPVKWGGTLREQDNFEVFRHKLKRRYELEANFRLTPGAEDDPGE